MTVHWNSRRGFAAGANTTTSADARAAEEEARAYLAELLLTMRKTPELRAAHIHRAKKLLAEPGYPSQDVLKAVAEVLARKFTKRTSE
jgi:hypothetical protein